MDGRQMLWQAPTFPFTRHLESRFGQILAEAEQIQVADYDAWPQTDGYTGGWKVFGLYSRDPEWVFAKGCDVRGRRCPRTLQALRRIRGLSRAGFSMMLPGTHIVPHTDGRDGDQDLLRCHLGLLCNDKSGMRVAGTTVHWGPGRCMMFDGQAEHEAANFGTTPRVILLLDVDRAEIASPLLPASVEGEGAGEATA